jgi:DNA-binding MarR family transcriptional regulator
MYDTRNVDLIASALLDLIGCLNSPRQDDVLLREAGVSLDRALFPLLVRVSAASTLSVVKLAEQVGRDPSTVSRQLMKLEQLGLVRRVASRDDLRVRDATVTKSGSRTIAAITAARRKLLNELIQHWSPDERAMLPRLLQRLADTMKERLRHEC